MVVALNRISTSQYRAIKDPGTYPDGGGLLLIVGPTGSKSWKWRYRFRGKRCDMGLGSAPSVGLAEARKGAEQGRKWLQDGFDPITESRRLKAGRGDRKDVPTFGEYADALVVQLSSTWKKGSTSEGAWKRSFEKHAKAIRKLPLDSITSNDILAFIRPMWAKNLPSARKTVQRIELVFDTAKVAGIISGDNPARWLGHLKLLLPMPKRRVVVHHYALPYDEMPALYAKLEARRAIGARVVQFITLTATRKSMVLGMRWSEVDFKRRVWTIPAERMKVANEHRVPLTDEMLAILNARPRYAGVDHVFTWGPKHLPLKNNTTYAILRRIYPDAKLTAHGIRSTFRDWVGNETDFSTELAEIALSHAAGNEVERAYRRGDMLEKRALLMQAWGEFVTQTEKKKPANDAGSVGRKLEEEAA